MKTVCIILNYNDPDTTAALAERIRNYSCLDAVLLVDNASTDGSVEKLMPLVSGKVMLVQSGKNGGYGAGNNLGMRYAREILKADLCLIANPDTEFSEDCVRRMIGAFKRHPSLGILAPVQKNAGRESLTPGSRQQTLYGAAAWPLRPWFYDLLESGPVCRRLLQPILHYPEQWFSKAGEDPEALVAVDCVPGSLLMADLRKMQEAGGYDEQVFLYEEEVIIGQRMKAAGYRTALLPNQSYLHRHGVSIGQSVKSLLGRQKLREESTLYYFRHYLGAGRGALLMSRLFFAAVNLEVRLLGGLSAC